MKCTENPEKIKIKKSSYKNLKKFFQKMSNENFIKIQQENEKTIIIEILKTKKLLDYTPTY